MSSHIEIGDIVRTPDSPADIEGVGSQPEAHYGMMGEVRNKTGVGNVRVMPREDVEEKPDHAFIWTPSDLTLHRKGEDNLDDIEEGDEIRPRLPGHWSYGGEDLKEDHFYTLQEVDKSQGYVVIRDDMGDETRTLQPHADILEVRGDEVPEKGDKVVYGGNIYTVFSNPSDVDVVILESLSSGGGLVKADRNDLSEVPDMTVDSIDGYSVEYNYETERFEVGCRSVNAEDVVALAEWYKDLQ